MKICKFKMAGKKLRSGRELVKLFERAGCLAEDTTLSGEDLDWVFETSDVATLEFLDWACENLHEENVLTDSEILEWEELKQKSPESILSGSRLEEAIHMLKDKDSGVLLQRDEEVKQRTVGQIREELNVMETTVNDALHVNRCISLALTKLCVLQGKFEEKKTEVTRELAAKQKKLIKTNEELKMSLDQLSNHISKTEGLIFGQQNTLFLAESDLSPVVQESEKISDSVKSFLKARQELTDNGLASSWKGTRDINEFQELMKEIDRLRFSIADCEKSLAFEEAELASLKAGCQELEKQIYQIKQGKFCTDIDVLNLTSHKLEASLSEYVRKASTLLEETLAPLIDKKVALMCKDVLASDLKEKILRQSSVIVEMDAVISILLQLVSIQEVLGSLLQHEVQSLETLRACLESITQTQKEVQDNHQTQLDRFETAKKLKIKNSRKTLLSDDAIALAIKKCVCPNDLESGVLTSEDILRSVEVLNDQTEDMESKITSKDRDIETERLKITSLIDEIQSELQMKSSSFGMLTAPEVSARIQQLSADIRYVETSMRDVVEAWDKARRSILDHPAFITERGIWKDYFVQPEMLERTLQKLPSKQK